MKDLDFDYIRTTPTKWTFSLPKIRRIIEDELEGRVLNLFAGKTRLNHSDEIVRNDLNEEIDADYHFDAIDVDEHFRRGSFDTVILDAPWSVRKGREKYEGRFKGHLTVIKDKIAPLIRSQGKVITCGFSSVGMSKKRGFEKEKIYLLCYGGDHRDGIFLVERKILSDLEEWE